eukprot:scaffold183509_cov20-Prasinocladus_malaysianus.AAC.1
MGLGIGRGSDKHIHRTIASTLCFRIAASTYKELRYWHGVFSSASHLLHTFASVIFVNLPGTLPKQPQVFFPLRM